MVKETETEQGKVLEMTREDLIRLIRSLSEEELDGVLLKVSGKDGR